MWSSGKVYFSSKPLEHMGWLNCCGLSLTNSILLFENEGQGVFRSPVTITDTLTTVMSITSFNGHVFGASPADSNIVMFRYDNAVFSGTSITRAVNSPRHICCSRVIARTLA